MSTETTNAFFDATAALSGFANATGGGLWQSLKALPAAALNLIAVELYGKTPDGVDQVSGVGLKVYDGVGTGGAVFAAVSAVTVVDVASAPAWIRFEFPGPFSALVPGNDYTIEITGAGAAQFLWGYALVTPFIDYPDGTASFQPPCDLFFRVKTTPDTVNPDLPTAFAFLTVDDGSAVAPSYSFNNDTAVGLFLETAVVPTAVGLAGDLTPAVTGVTQLGVLNRPFGDIFQGNLNRALTQFRTLSNTLVLTDATAGTYLPTLTLNEYVDFRIGRMVMFTLNMAWTPGTGVPTGTALTVTGLPDPSIAGRISPLTIIATLNNTPNVTLAASIPANGTEILFYEFTGGAAPTQIVDTAADTAPGTGSLLITGTYLTPDFLPP